MQYFTVGFALAFMVPMAFEIAELLQRLPQ